MRDYDPNDFLPQLPHLEQPIADARRLLAEGATLEAVLRHLRAAGCDMIDSKWVAMIVFGMKRHEADRALYLSDAWADLRPAIDQIDAVMLELARQQGAEVRLVDDPVAPTPRH